jgi:hypothetical protein
MKDRLCPDTTPCSQNIQVRRSQRWTLNVHQKSAFVCVLVGIAPFREFTTICIGCQDGADNRNR